MYILFMCTFLAGILEGIGILMLFPFLQTLDNNILENSEVGAFSLHLLKF